VTAPNQTARLYGADAVRGGAVSVLEHLDAEVVVADVPGQVTRTYPPSSGIRRTICYYCNSVL
jgi:hypothetical protein